MADQVRQLHLIPETESDSKRDALSFMPDVVGRVFRLMDVAEHDIADMMREHPSRAYEIHGMFGELAAPKLFYANDICYDIVFERYCRQQIERRLNNVDTKQITNAELCILFSLASLQHPLSSEAEAAYAQAFAQTFPERQELPAPIDVNLYKWAIPEANARMAKGYRRD